MSIFKTEKTITERKRILKNVCVFALAIMPMYPNSGQAQQTLNWIGSGLPTEFYHLESNWLENAIPDADDDVVFGIAFAFPITINFSRDSAADDLRILNSEFIFRSANIEGQPLTTLDTNSMEIDGDAKVTLEFGINNDSFRLITGDFNHEGELHVTQGTSFTADQINVNIGETGDPALLRVSGQNNGTASLLQAESLEIGLAAVRLDGGARAEIATDTFISLFDSDGELSIDGTGNPIQPTQLTTRNFLAGPGSDITLAGASKLVVKNILATQENIGSPGLIVASEPEARIEIVNELRLVGGNILIEQGAQLETTLMNTRRIGGEPLLTQPTQLNVRSTDANSISRWTNTGDVFVGGTNTTPDSNGGEIKVDGANVVIGGTLQIWDAGRFIVSETNAVPTTMVVDTIDNSFGGQFDFESGKLSVDLFFGELDQQSGVLAPGDDEFGSLPGQTIVAGDYFQFQDARLAVDVAGTIPMFLHDTVEVGGFMFVDGSLDVTLQNGFSPNNSDEIIIASAANVIGSFNNVASGDRLTTADGTGSFIVSYGLSSPFDAGQVVLTEFEQGDVVLGDVNGDGTVDLLDIAPFVDALTGGTFIPAADINQDGTVNLLDVQPFVELLTS